MNDAKIIWKLETQLGDARRELAQLETETLELVTDYKDLFVIAKAAELIDPIEHNSWMKSLDQPTISKLLEAKDDT